MSSAGMPSAVYLPAAVAHATWMPKIGVKGRMPPSMMPPPSGTSVPPLPPTVLPRTFRIIARSMRCTPRMTSPHRAASRRTSLRSATGTASSANRQHCCRGRWVGGDKDRGRWTAVRVGSGTDGWQYGWTAVRVNGSAGGSMAVRVDQVASLRQSGAAAGRKMDG